MTSTAAHDAPLASHQVDATRMVKNFLLWPFDAMAVLWPLLIILLWASFGQHNAASYLHLAAQTAEAGASIAVAHLYVAREATGRKVPRWLLPLLVALAALSLLTAAWTYTPAQMPPMALEIAFVGILMFPLMATATTLSTRRLLGLCVLASVLTVGLVGVVFGLWGAEWIVALGNSIAAAAPIAICMIVMPLTMRWGFTVAYKVSAGERLAQVQSQLAVAEERLRIARDLHDVFGRTLTAVAVKSELVAALADAEDAPRAAAEARSVRLVADEALREVRSVLAEYRRPDLAKEISGALSLLESAGIATRLIGSVDVPPWASEPLALVLREAATNVVRHSAATWCTIRLTLDDQLASLEIANDRAHAPAPPMDDEAPSSGLKSLAERLRDFGGTLKTSVRADVFTLAAQLPAPGVARDEQQIGDCGE